MPPVRAPLLCRRVIRLLSPGLFEMFGEWIALPCRRILEGDMGDIYRKLSFGSSAPPNAPKCNRQLISNAITGDTARRMRLPG